MTLRQWEVAHSWSLQLRSQSLGLISAATTWWCKQERRCYFFSLLRKMTSFLLDLEFGLSFRTFCNHQLSAAMIGMILKSFLFSFSHMLDPEWIAKKIHRITYLQAYCHDLIKVMSSSWFHAWIFWSGKPEQCISTHRFEVTISRASIHWRWLSQRIWLHYPCILIEPTTRLWCNNLKKQPPWSGIIAHLWYIFFRLLHVSLSQLTIVSTLKKSWSQFTAYENRNRAVS